MSNLHFGSCSAVLQFQLCVCTRPHTASALERPLPDWYRAALVYPPPVRHLGAKQTTYSCAHILWIALKHIQSHSNTHVASPILISSIRFSLWVWQTWVRSELFSWHIPPPWWWGSWSCGVGRGPGTHRSCQFLRCCHCLVSRAAFASSAVEAGCLKRSGNETGSKGNPGGKSASVDFTAFNSLKSLTFRTLSVIMWVFGVLRDTLRTITQFITTMVVTDITNIRYLQSRLNFIIYMKWNNLTSELKSSSRVTHMDLLPNKRHCFWCLWNLLSDKEEEHSLAQKSGNRHGALLTTGCKTQNNIQSAERWDCVLMKTDTNNLL